MPINYILLYNKFTHSLDGTDSYVELKNGLDLLIHKDKENAAIYFTLYGFAYSYVQLYADQPVTPDFARKAKLELQSYLSIALQAFTDKNSPENKWNILNEIIHNYANSKKIF